MIKVISTLAAGFFATSLILGAMASFQVKQWPSIIPDRLPVSSTGQVPAIVQPDTPSQPTISQPDH